MSNEKKHCCLGYIGDYTNYVGIIINHKGSLLNNQYNEGKAFFLWFFSWILYTAKLHIAKLPWYLQVGNPQRQSLMPLLCWPRTALWDFGTRFPMGNGKIDR